MKVRPLLLLDIDGVLNPWAAPTCPEGFNEFVLFPKDEQAHRLATHHGEWIRDLAGAFEVVWASAWGSAANDLVAPILDLPPFEWVRYPPDPFPPVTKVPSISDFVGDRAAAWIDDMIGPDGWEWASTRQAPTLLIEADPAVGWTLEHVAELRSWSDQLGDP